VIRTDVKTENAARRRGGVCC